MSFFKESKVRLNYFQYILMGLEKTLKEQSGITKTHIKKLSPVKYSDISEWERKNGVLMPEDMRLFYLASNGFSFIWLYIYKHEYERSVLKIKGALKINSIEDLVPMYGYETSSNSGVSFDGEKFVIRLSLASKVFKLAPLPDFGYIVLVYLDPKYLPTICSFTENHSLNFISNDLATYFRMSIAHLTIPHWQLAYTPSGIPQWSENIFRLLSPHLLPLNNNISKGTQKQKKYDNTKEPILNKLNPDILMPCVATPPQTLTKSSTKNTDDGKLATVMNFI